MKNVLLLFFLIFIYIFKIQAQDSLRISSHLDSLPIIRIEKNAPLLILGIYTGAWQMGASCNNYFIGNEKYLNPTPMKPYFDKLGDSKVINDYQQHRDLKPIYLTGYGTGMLLYIYGFGKGLGKTLGTIIGGQPYSKLNNGQTEIYAGLGMIIVATAIRIISFSHLRKANKRYNELISKPKTAFEVRPSQDGLGLGLWTSF